MSLRGELLTLLAEKIKDAGQETDVPLTDETTLLSSGLISSLHMLELATWIEERLEGPIDLTAVNPLEAWDTPRAILDDIDRHRTVAPDDSAI